MNIIFFLSSDRLLVIFILDTFEKIKLKFSKYTEILNGILISEIKSVSSLSCLHVYSLDDLSEFISLNSSDIISLSLFFFLSIKTILSSSIEFELLLIVSSESISIFLLIIYLSKSFS